MTNEFESIDYEKAPWTVIDAGLVRADKQIATRDYWLMKCLIQIEAREIHREAKFKRLADYMHARLGWDPHTTAERLRTAKALEGLPLLSAAMREGTLRWTAARELTRIAIPETEAEWLAEARKRSVHALAIMCSTRYRGQLPTDPADPNLMVQILRLECRGESYGFLRSVIDQVRAVHGQDLSDAECLVVAIQEHEAKYRIDATFCPGCLQAGVRSGDVDAPITVTTLEMLMCNAQVIGPDGRMAQRYIPINVVNAVRARARGCCEIPGCKARRWCRTHHIKLFSAGGTHTVQNLIYVCAVHHAMIHEGLLWLVGACFAELKFTFADGTPLGSQPDEALTAAYHATYLHLRAEAFPEQMAHDALIEVRKKSRAPKQQEIHAAALKVIARLAAEERARRQKPESEPAVVAEPGWTSHVGLFTRDAEVEYVTAH